MAFLGNAIIKILTGALEKQLEKVALCQLRTFVVHPDEYTALFAFTIKQARFEQINRHIYLLLKKEKYSSLVT